MIIVSGYNIAVIDGFIVLQWDWDDLVESFAHIASNSISQLPIKWLVRSTGQNSNCWCHL